jgi:uncharacterized membrane protein
VTSPAATPETSAQTGRGDQALALDLVVARLLSTGTLAAVILLAVGVVLMAIAGTSPMQAGFPPLDLARLPADLVALRAEGFLWLGLLAVIVTPTSRVIASLLGYIRASDRPMVLISLAILAVIATSVVTSSVIS